MDLAGRQDTTEAGKEEDHFLNVTGKSKDMETRKGECHYSTFGIRTPQNLITISVRPTRKVHGFSPTKVVFISGMILHLIRFTIRMPRLFQQELTLYPS